MKVTVSKWIFRGIEKWAVKWKVPGAKRKVRQFFSKQEAENTAKDLRKQFAKTGHVWAAMSGKERAQVIQILFEIKEAGLNLELVWDGYKKKPQEGLTRKSIRDAIAALLAAKTAAKKTKRYIESLEAYLAKFAKGRETMFVDQFRLEHIEAWFDSRTTENPETKSSNMGRISSLFGYCVRKKWCAENPVDQMEKIKIVVKRPNIFTLKDAQRLLFVCYWKVPDFLPYIVLAMLLGIRPEENADLLWGNIDLKQGRISIDRAKPARARTINVAEDAHPMALEWLRLCTPGNPTDPVFPSAVTIRRRRRLVRDLCHIKKWPQDGLRKTAASYLMELKKDAPKVAFTLGTSVKMLMQRYVNIVSKEDCASLWAFVPKPLPRRVGAKKNS